MHFKIAFAATVLATSAVAKDDVPNLRKLNMGYGSGSGSGFEPVVTDPPTLAPTGWKGDEWKDDGFERKLSSV